MSPGPERTPSDVDVLAGAILALAGAFASNPFLHALVGGDTAPPLLSRLAPAQTMDRLWVVFVLIPAVIAFVGIGVPYAFRVLLTALRGHLTRGQVVTVLALASSSALVVADLVLGRSGMLPLLATCAVTLWRAGAAFRTPAGRLAPTLVAIAGGALLGLAFYQRGLLSGGVASVAVAPTLVLLGFYAGLTGVLGALLAATAPRAPVWLGAASATVAMMWCGGLRAVHLLAAGGEATELTLTLLAGTALIALAVVSKRTPTPVALGRDFR